MHMKRLRCAAAFVSVLASSVAAAAPLTLDSALRRAWDANPAVVEAKAEIEAARAERDAAARVLRYNPTLSAAAGPRYGGDSSTVDLGVELSQPIEIAGQRGKRLEAAEAALRTTQRRADELRADVAIQVSAAFFGTLAAEDRVRAAERAVDYARQSSTAARERFEAGAATQIDVNAALVDLGRSQRELLAARQARLQARAELALLLALTSDAELELSGTLEEGTTSSADVPARDEAVRAALTRRPDLLAARAALERARAEASLARREGFPTPSLGVSVEREADEQIVQGLLSFELPVFERNQAARGVTNARVTQAETALAALERRAEREVDLALQRLATAREVVAAFQKGINAAAEDNVTLVQEGYRAGKLDLYQLLLIQRDALEARRGYLDALEELANARAQLTRVTGGFKQP